jgi:DNA polymerase-3 subunit alpha
MPIEQIEAARKAIKASTEDQVSDAMVSMKAIMDDMFVLGRKAGLAQSDLEFLQTALMGYASYGFNKAHATAYGLLSYRSAYLKVHYPTEFMAATLDVWAGDKKESKYIEEAHRLGMTIHRPHVNKSTEGWSVEGPNKLRRGFRSIKGVGPAGAVALAELAPYESLEDLCQRVPGRALPGGKKYLKERVIIEGNALGALYESGALDSLPDVQPKEEAS